MRNKFKGILIGIITGTIISATTGFALNGSIQKMLEYRDIKICVDGERITPMDAEGNYVEPFIIDGTTYLPVRAVANALGKEVSWDGNTHTFYIGKKPESKHMDAFKADIENVIAKHGKYVDKDYMGIYGLKYGTLIDFEKDGVPELVLVRDWMVEIYRFDGEKSTKIFEEKAGSRFMQTDVSYTIGINTTIAEPCVITYQSEDSWTTEELHVFTVKNGQPNVQVLYAGEPIMNEYYDPSDDFTVFKIDNVNVSEDAYMSLKNTIFSGEQEVDVCWNYDYEMPDNYIHASDEELDLFLSQFGL